jgi:hypothetical protein
MLLVRTASLVILPVNVHDARIQKPSIIQYLAQYTDNCWTATFVIIKVIVSNRTRSAGLVARVGETRDTYKVLVGKPQKT